MKNFARHILEIASGSVHVVRDRIRSVVDLTISAASAMWARHRRLLDDRPEYGSQLAALVAILVALANAPAWAVRLLNSLIDLYLASTRAGRGQQVTPYWVTDEDTWEPV